MNNHQVEEGWMVLFLTFDIGWELEGGVMEGENFWKIEILKGVIRKNEFEVF